MRIDIIAKPADPSSVEKLRPEVDRLREQEHDVHVHLTYEAGDACRFARDAADAGSRLVIAAGGDGTLNEAANGLHAHVEGRAARSRRTSGSRRSDGIDIPRLAVIPLGTANDMANNLGIPSDVSAAIEVALNGEASWMDVPRVNGRCFLNVSAGGFGAEATGETSPEAKHALGTLAYLITAVKKFARLEPSPARFIAGELLYDGPFLLFAVGNLQKTGGGQQLTPEADPVDGALDVCIVKELPRAKFLALLPDLHSGSHLEHEAVLYHRVPRLLVESAESLTVNADGEPLQGRSFQYEISPHRLLVVRPRGAAAGAAA